MAALRTLAAAAALALVAVVVPVAHAGVTIIPPKGQSPVTLTDQQFEDAIDVRDRSYTVGDRPFELSGVSVPALVAAANADPSFSFIEIARPGGDPLRLSDQQVESDGAFPEGKPIVYRDSSGGYSFLRPAGADGSPAEVISLAGTGIGLRTGNLIEVELSATKPIVERGGIKTMTVKPGAEVKFTAYVQKGDAQQLEYSWTVKGLNESSSGTEHTQRFDKRGSFSVSLGVTAAGDDSGGSDVVRVQVGKLDHKSDKSGDGGKNDSPNASEDGMLNGPTGGEGSATGDGNATPAATGTPEATTPQADPPPTEQPQPEDEKAEPVTAIGPAAMVSGELLSKLSGSPRSKLGQALRSALGSGVPPKATAVTEGLGVSSVGLGLATTLALLGVGAALELRSARGPRRRA
jgi:hypothetical protein